MVLCGPLKCRALLENDLMLYETPVLEVGHFSAPVLLHVTHWSIVTFSCVPDQHPQQVGNQRLLKKPCSPHYLLPDNFVSQTWFMALAKLLLTWDLTILCSASSAHQHYLLPVAPQPSSPHLCSQQPCLTWVSPRHAINQRHREQPHRLLPPLWRRFQPEYLPTFTCTWLVKSNKLPCTLLPASLSTFGFYDTWLILKRQLQTASQTV